MIYIAMILAAVAAAPGETFDGNSMPADYWRNPRRCGPNCLYAYLSIHRHSVPLRAVVDRVPIGAAGANMADLRRAATDLGVPSQIVKTTPERLADFPLPAIAHLQSREGHFVLVLRVNHDTVTTADMLGGTVETLPADLFFERWSGYLLVPGTRTLMPSWPLLTTGAVAAALLALPPAADTPADRGRVMRRRVICIVGVCAAALMLILGGLSNMRSGQRFHEEGSSGAILAQPVSVRPLRPRGGDELGRLSAERWVAISRKFYPNRVVPDVSFLLHHLLNWGPDARFAESTGALSGPAMLEILTDGRANRLYTSKSPLLYRGQDGRPRLARYGERGSETHPNQVLASFASMGLPSSRLVWSGGDSATIAELVEAARSDFHLQGEIERTTVALACYAPTARPWTNRWGRSFDFDMIAQHLIARPFGEGACAGTHLLYALTAILRVDAEHRLVSDRMKGRMRRHLAGAIERLEAHQRTSGCWTPDWPLPLAEAGYETYDDAIFGEARLVQATGHHLEWLDIAPPDLPIDEGVRRRALNWCVAALERAPAIDDQRLCPYSHCFRMARRYAAPTGYSTEESALP